MWFERKQFLDRVDVIEFVCVELQMRYKTYLKWKYYSFIILSFFKIPFRNSNWNFDYNIWFVLWFRFNLTFKVFISNNIIIMSITRYNYIYHEEQTIYLIKFQMLLFHDFSLIYRIASLTQEDFDFIRTVMQQSFVWASLFTRNINKNRGETKVHYSRHLTETFKFTTTEQFSFSIAGTCTREGKAHIYLDSLYESYFVTKP